MAEVVLLRFLQNRCQKFFKIHMKTTVLESLFNKVAGLIENEKKLLRYRRFPVNFAKFCRTPF